MMSMNMVLLAALCVFAFASTALAQQKCLAEADFSAAANADDRALMRDQALAAVQKARDNAIALAEDEYQTRKKAIELAHQSGAAVCIKENALVSAAVDEADVEKRASQARQQVNSQFAAANSQANANLNAKLEACKLRPAALLNSCVNEARADSQAAVQRLQLEKTLGETGVSSTASKTVLKLRAAKDSLLGTAGSAANRLTGTVGSIKGKGLGLTRNTLGTAGRVVGGVPSTAGGVVNRLGNTATGTGGRVVGGVVPTATRLVGGAGQQVGSVVGGTRVDTRTDVDASAEVSAETDTGAGAGGLLPVIRG